MNKKYATMKRLIEQIADLTSKTHQYQKYRDQKLRSFHGILLAFNYRAVIESEQQLTRFRACRRTHTFSLGGVYGFQKVALCATSDSNADVEREVTTRREKRAKKRETSADSEKMPQVATV